MATEPGTITVNVSMPKPLKLYVDGKVSSGLYGSTSEFVREAIREKLDRDQERLQARRVLTAKIVEGLASGPSVPYTKDHFKQKKLALIRRMKRDSGRS